MSGRQAAQRAGGPVRAAHVLDAVVMSHPSKCCHARYPNIEANVFVFDIEKDVFVRVGARIEAELVGRAISLQHQDSNRHKDTTTMIENRRPNVVE
jgi:hypothetical protein